MPSVRVLCVVGLSLIVTVQAAKADDGSFFPLFWGWGQPRAQQPHPQGRAAYAPQERDRSLAREYPATTRELVSDLTHSRPGTITIDTAGRALYLSLSNGLALRYRVGVGREGFTWRGMRRIGRMAAWPSWSPPAAMLRRRPDLPRYMSGGLENPLGARALYLYAGDHDSGFRIHGSNEPWTIGEAVSSGCIRMLNADVEDLYGRVRIGTTVIVL